MREGALVIYRRLIKVLDDLLGGPYFPARPWLAGLAVIRFLFKFHRLFLRRDFWKIFELSGLFQFGA